MSHDPFMTFQEALVNAQSGQAIARFDWPEGTFAYQPVPQQVPADIIPRMTSLPEPVRQILIRKGGPIHYQNELKIVDNDNVIRAWIPQVVDLEASDWFVIYPPKPA